VRSASGRGGAARRRDSRAAAAAAAASPQECLTEEARRPFKGAVTAAAGTSPGARP
jgi:hypothetical protein